MKGYIDNIEQKTRDNTAFRTVLYTARYTQLVAMRIEPHGEIGEEVHGVDQFFRIEAGKGLAIIDGVEHAIEDGSAVIVPAGATHNIVSTSDEPLLLYTLYSPPHHRDGVIHPTKADAEADSEEFDGRTTE